MPELPAQAEEVEKIVRVALVELFGGIDGLPHVLDHATYVDGESAYVREFGFKHEHGKGTEFRLLEIVFEDFTDTDEGCEDNPVYKLNYALTLIVSHAGKRSDTSTSTDDFARLTLMLRDRALRANHLKGYGALECENLVPVASRFGPDDELRLKAAHVAAFSLSVKVTPKSAEVTP